MPAEPDLPLVQLHRPDAARAAGADEAVAKRLSAELHLRSGAHELRRNAHLLREGRLLESGVNGAADNAAAHDDIAERVQ